MCQQCAKLDDQSGTDDVFVMAGEVAASGDVLGADVVLAGDDGLVLDAEAAGLGTADILSAAPLTDGSGRDGVGVDGAELDFSMASVASGIGSTGPLVAPGGVTYDPGVVENGTADPAITVALSGNPVIDGVLWRTKWSDGYITYSDPDSIGDYQAGYSGGSGQPNYAVGFGQLSANQLRAAHAILNEAVYTQLPAAAGLAVEAFTNLGIDYAGAGTGNSTLRLANTSSSVVGTARVADFPGGSISGNPIYGGDVWYGGSGDFPTTGNYDYATTIHELGHALGLKHGHQASNHYGSGAPVLPFATDSMEYSIMTYRSYVGASTTGGYTNETWGYAQTFMMYDIAALQYLYGADFGANSGNTTYTWTPGSGNTVINGNIALQPGGNRIFATIWDGNGIDTYDLSAYSTNLSVNLAPGGYSVFSSAQLADLNQFQAGFEARGNIFNAMQYNGDARSLIENAIGGSGNDLIQGNAANNTLTGNAGNDTLYGWDGNDYLYGGTGTVVAVGGNGNDIFYDGNSGTGDAFYGGAGTDSLVADFTWVDAVLYDLTNGWMRYPGSTGTTYDTINSVENLYVGGGADVIGSADNNLIYIYDTGPYSDNTISTLGGNDTVYAGIGNDDLYGGDDDDTLYGGDGDDNIYGGGGVDAMYGGNGDDVMSIDFGSTGHIANGGNGSDTIDFSYSGGSWTINLVAGTTLLGGTNYTTLTSVENATGGSGNDTIIGTTAANVISGGGGNDDLNAGAGQDTVYGGDGNDTITDEQGMGASDDDYYDGGAGIDTLVHDLSWVASVKFDLNAGWSTYNGNRDRLISIENLVVGGAAQVVGSGDNNVITVNGTGANIISALGGNDTVYANGGDDTVKGGNGNDVIYGGDGNDSLDGENDDDVLVGGDGDDYLLGRQGTDTLYGGNGNDELDGDDMYGGDGNDVYRIRSASNTVNEAAGQGIDTVNSSVNLFALAANVENLNLLSPAYFGYGNGLDNIINGTSGKNKLDGLDGNDFVYGGGSRDFVFGGNGNDWIFGGSGDDGVFAGEGADRVYGDDGNDKVGGGAGNDFVYGGAGDDELTGDNNNDVLYGGDGDDILDGGSVRDTMYGGAGNDLIYGGVGIDVLDGGTGNDQFVYNDVAWSEPGREDRVVGGFDNPGNVFGDRFNLAGIDADTTVGGNQAFSYGGSQGAGPLTTSTGYFWFVNVGSDTHLRANNDADAAFDFDVIIEDGAVLASAYNGFDVIG